MEKFIKNFAEQFDETDASEFTAKTEFKELDEWDSMMALAIIAMVDEEYDATINGDDILGANTVEDLFKTVTSK